MDEKTTAQRQSETRGVLVTISDSGKIGFQILGNINEAEFLGIAMYLQNTLLREGLLAILDGQRATAGILTDIAENGLLAARVRQETETGEEPCSKEQCSGCSHSSDSGQSSESSQVESEK